MGKQSERWQLAASSSSFKMYLNTKKFQLDALFLNTSSNKHQLEIGLYIFTYLIKRNDSSPETVKNNKKRARTLNLQSICKALSHVKIEYLTECCILCTSIHENPVSSILMFYFSSSTRIPHTPAVLPQICTTLISTIQNFQLFQLSQKVTGAS